MCLADEAAGAPTNVVLFPAMWRIAKRDAEELACPAASMALIWAIEPAFRDVALAGELGGFALPPSDLSERVCEETARYVLEQVLPLALTEQRRALGHLLEPVLATALTACRDAAGSVRRSRKAAAEVERARVDGGYWMEPREQLADVLRREAARLLIVAHVRCQEARGVERAVGLARCGEAWPGPGGAARPEWRGAAEVSA